MIANFIYFVALLFSTSAFGIGLSIVVWRRQTEKIWSTSFAALCVAASLWTAGYGAEIVASTLEGKLFWAKVQYIGIVMAPVAWYFFSLYFTNRRYALFKLNYLYFLIVPFITLFLVWFNGRFQLIWTSTTMTTHTPLPLLAVEYGWWFWVHSAYSYLLMVLGTGTIALSIFLTPSTHRRQNILLMVAALMPWSGNLLYLSRATQLDFSPVGFVGSGLMVSWAIFRLQLFDLIPIGRKAVIDHMADAFMVLDLEERIVDVNPAARKIFGGQRPLIGEQFTDVINHRRVNALLRRQRLARTEIALGSGAQLKTYDLIISPLFTQWHRFHGELLVFRDVTIERLAKDELEKRVERRTAELAAANQKLLQRAQELEEMDRLKSLFLATMSHELRTPLNSILGFTELILDQYVGPVTTEMETELQTIYRNGEHLLSLINDILDMAKIEAGQLLLETEPVNVNALIIDVLYSLKPLAEQKSISFLTQFNEEALYVVADQNRLRQIMINVVGNALKFSEKGEIVMVTAVDKEHATIIVKDHGVGIPKDQIGQIFDAFYRVDDELHRKARGTGLGLPISKRLVELQQGDIWAESSGIPGEGATFFIRLPILSKVEQVG